MWKKIVRRDSAVAVKNLDYNTLEYQLIQGMRESNLLPPKKASSARQTPTSNGSFHRTGSFFDTPPPRQSIFAALSPSPHGSNQSPAKSPLKSLFGDVDTNSQHGSQHGGSQHGGSQHGSQQGSRHGSFTTSSPTKDIKPESNKSQEPAPVNEDKVPEVTVENVAVETSVNEDDDKEETVKEAPPVEEPAVEIPEEELPVVDYYNFRKSFSFVESRKSLKAESLEVDEKDIEFTVSEDTTIQQQAEVAIPVETDHSEHVENEPDVHEHYQPKVEESPEKLHNESEIDFISEIAESEVHSELVNDDSIVQLSFQQEPEVPLSPTAESMIPDISEARLAVHELFLNTSLSNDQHLKDEESAELVKEGIMIIVEEEEPAIHEEISPIVKESIINEEEDIVEQEVPEELVATIVETVLQEATEAVEIDVEVKDVIETILEAATEKLSHEEKPQVVENVEHIESAVLDVQEPEISITTVPTMSEDKFDADKGVPSLKQGSADSAGSIDYQGHFATSYDSRYEHIELRELHQIYDLQSSESLPQTVNSLFLKRKASAGSMAAEPTENLPEQEAPQEENTQPSESVNNSSTQIIHNTESQENKLSSNDTTDHAESERKSSYDDDHDDADEEDEEEEGKEPRPEEWEIDIYAQSDGEIIEMGFGYDTIHRYNSEFDELPPPVTEIYFPSQDERDQSNQFEELSEVGDDDPLNISDVEGDHHHNHDSGLDEHESISSVGMDDRDSSVAVSHARSEVDEVAQCAQIMESSNLPKCLNLANAQRTDNNIDFEKYLSKDLFDKVRILILRENFFTDIYSINLRDLFPKLRELDLTKNYIGPEILSRTFTSRLRKLDLSRNQISNIKGLITCKRLEELNLSYNRIRFLEPLPPSLTSLDISCNWIDSATTFRILSKNHKLIDLDISGNAIALVKNIEWNIKTLVPALLKCSIVYDRMLMKRKVSPRIKSLGGSNYSKTSSTASPASTGNNNNKPAATSSPQREQHHHHHSPVPPTHPGGNTATVASMLHHQQHVAHQHQQHQHHSPQQHSSPAPTTSAQTATPGSGNRLESAVKALRSGDQKNQSTRLEYLKKAKEFSGKLRESQLKKPTPFASSLKSTSQASSEMKESDPQQQQNGPSIVIPSPTAKSAAANTSYIPVTTTNLVHHNRGSPVPPSSQRQQQQQSHLHSETSSHISHHSHATNRTNQTSNTLKRTYSSSTNPDGRLSFGSVNSTNSANQNHNGLRTGSASFSTNKLNGTKYVASWIVKTQNKITRCLNILTMIINLAKTELLLSATTHYGLLQEWAKIGFFDLNPSICSFTVLIKPEFLCIENINEIDDDYKDVGISDLLVADNLFQEINEFHELFIQIYIALEISILHQINFKLLLDSIMKTEIGMKINSRYDGLYFEIQSSSHDEGDHHQQPQQEQQQPEELPEGVDHSEGGMNQVHLFQNLHKPESMDFTSY